MYLKIGERSKLKTTTLLVFFSWLVVYGLLQINDLPDDVSYDITIYGGDTTLYSKCNQASELGQQLELVSELESDKRDTVNWGRKWLVDFYAVKTQLILFDRPNNTRAIDAKMAGSALEEKSSFKMLGLTFH